MIQSINNFLEPADKFFRKNEKYFIYFFYFASIFWVFYSVQKYFFVPMDLYRFSLVSARHSMALLAILLWMPIFSRVFGIKIFGSFLSLRQSMGIWMGITALAHAVFMLINYFPKNPVELFFGFLPQIIILLLTITSNKFSQKFLGKNWKRWHRLAYLIPILVIIQIFLASSHFSFLFAIFWCIFYFFKFLEFRGIKFFEEETKIYPKWQKFYCVPCGMIYDPAIGDMDGGIPPGTEFSDIPDSWRCPECGVTKSDFLPYDENFAIELTKLKISEKIFLNPTTIELILEKNTNHEPKIGQFATFEFEDADGKFRRQYSVAKSENGKIHFFIKLKKDGRWAKILAKISRGETINFVGFFGDFILQENKNPKVFIATGTGLAPIFYMINASKNIPKKIFMSVSTADEIFYYEELAKIPNLEVVYHISRENVNGFRSGRIVVEEILNHSDKNTEFYLCGSPSVIEEFVPKIQNAGFENVYFEKFN